MKVFLAILIAGLVAQIIKILIITLKYKQRFHYKDLFLTGGMPSTHSALMSSLALAIYFEQGFSTLFFVVLVLFLIVLRDATGVRRTAGEEGMLLNKIIRATKLKLEKVHYSLGHTPAEVIVGILIGLIASFIVYA